MAADEQFRRVDNLQSVLGQNFQDYSRRDAPWWSSLPESVSVGAACSALLQAPRYRKMRDWVMRFSPEELRENPDVLRDTFIRLAIGMVENAQYSNRKNDHKFTLRGQSFQDLLINKLSLSIAQEAVPEIVAAQSVRAHEGAAWQTHIYGWFTALPLASRRINQIEVERLQRMVGEIHKQKNESHSAILAGLYDASAKVYCVVPQDTPDEHLALLRKLGVEPYIATFTLNQLGEALVAFQERDQQKSEGEEIAVMPEAAFEQEPEVAEEVQKEDAALATSAQERVVKQQIINENITAILSGTPLGGEADGESPESLDEEDLLDGYRMLWDSDPTQRRPRTKKEKRQSSGNGNRRRQRRNEE